MDKNQHSTLMKIHPSRIILPIAIGVGVVFYILWKENPSEAIQQLQFTKELWFWFGMAIMLMLCRDLGYIIRLHLLADNQLSWIQCIRIVFLWEFASAVTPTAIGGTSVALLFLYKEKLPIGKGSAIILATSFLDELFFAIMFPFVIMVVGPWTLFHSESEVGTTTLLHNRYVLFAIIGYSVKLLYIVMVSYGLFVNPKSLKRVVKGIFKIRFLQKWKNAADKAGDDIIIASKELSHKSFSFWIQTFLATSFSWISRYWVANCLIIAVLCGLPSMENSAILKFSDHLLIFSKQLVMWIMTMVMPTPGGSGFSEIIFLDFMNVFIPIGFVSVVALAWRFISYYPYLFIGGFILPNWVRKRFHKKK